MKISNAVELCNLALLRVNRSPISSLTDDSLSAQACNQVYEQAREALLSQYNWTFALTGAELAVAIDNSRLPDETPDVYAARKDKRLIEYLRAYSLPADFLRLVYCYDSLNNILVCITGQKPPYLLEGNFILSDHSSLKLKYIKDIDVVSAFSPMFTDCLILDIAIRISKLMNDSSTYLQQLEADYQLQLEKAKISDCQQTNMYGVISYPLLWESYF